MLLTKEEEEKLLKTFSDFREKIKKYQEEVNNNPEIRNEIMKKYANKFLKSAGNGNKN
jgi:aromatic ring-opening dioxygenase catalytic subunit (LigB family)